MWPEADQLLTDPSKPRLDPGNASSASSSLVWSGLLGLQWDEVGQSSAPAKPLWCPGPRWADEGTLTCRVTVGDIH